MRVCRSESQKEWESERARVRRVGVKKSQSQRVRVTKSGSQEEWESGRVGVWKSGSLEEWES